MSKVVRIKPLDPLFFRMNRAFTAGEQDWASSRPFPLPSTVYGAIRTFILSKRDLNKFYEEGYFDIGSPKKKGTLKIKFIALKKDVEIFFPAPANLLCYEDKPLVMTPTIEEEDYLLLSKVRGLDNRLRFFYTRENVSKKENRWIGLSALVEFLKGNYDTIQCTNIHTIEEFTMPEPRVGIALDKKSRTAQEGRLYRAEHYRYLNNVEIVVWVEGTEESLNGILHLGGERRVAFLKEDGELKGKIEAKLKYDLSGDFDYVYLYLATPSIFESSWHPNIKNNFPMISAIVDSYELVGGWDIAKKKPKPLYRAVPAGSIYVFDKNGHSYLNEKFRLRNISQVYPEEGYGFALIGVI